MAQAQAISCEMERQAKLLPRWDIIKESVANYGCAIVFDGEEARAVGQRSNRLRAADGDNRISTGDLRRREDFV